MFEIIKQSTPRELYKEDDAVQVPEEHGVNVEIQVNDHDMEDDDNDNNTFEDDGTNTLMHETFSVGMDDDYDDFDDVHDITLLERARQSLYVGSKTVRVCKYLLSF